MPEETRVQIPETTSGLLSQVSREWSPHIFFERELVELKWGNVDLSPIARSVRAQGNALAVTCISSREDGPAALYPFLDLRNQSLTARTRDGFQLLASSVVASGRSQSHGGPDGGTVTLTITALNWSMWKDAAPAHLWVGEVRGDHGDHFGNLNLRGTWGGSWGHYRLEGSKYTYYLLNVGSKKEGTILAVDCSGEPFPSPTLFHDELQSMGVVFGSPIAVGRLVGVDQNREARGWVSGYFADQDQGRWIGAVVPVHEHKHCWIAPFFKKLCSYRATHPLPETKQFVLSTWYLLAAYRESAIDIRRAHLFLALTCMARHRCGIETIGDPEQWEPWVAEHRDEITRAAQGNPDYLVEQVRRQWIPSNTTYIRSALDRERLPITAPVEVELASGRDGLEGVVVENVADARTGLAVLRTLLGALMSRVIGYRGAIEGWKPNQFGWARPDDVWWPVNPEDEPDAFVIYDAESSDDLPAVRNLWPTFSVLTVPNSAPLSIVKSFALGLADRTNGRVLARLNPVPQANTTEIVYYDFLLYATASRVRVVLFTVYENDDRYLTVTEWDGESDIVLDNTFEIEGFLEKVATSKETEARIQRILLEEALFAEG